MFLSGFEDLTALRGVLIAQSQDKSIVLNSSQENTRCERLESVTVSYFFEDGANLAGEGFCSQCTQASKAEHKSQQSWCSPRWRIFTELPNGMQLLAVCCTPVISDGKPLHLPWLHLAAPD